MYLINEQKIKRLDPIEFGLSSRTAIGETGEEKIVLIKDRKSRIIMKDGRNILEQIERIKNTTTKEIAFATNAPICSKTTKFFQENKIEVYSIEKQNV